MEGEIEKEADNNYDVGIEAVNADNSNTEAGIEPVEADNNNTRTCTEPVEADNSNIEACTEPADINNTETCKKPVGPDNNSTEACKEPIEADGNNTKGCKEPIEASNSMGNSKNITAKALKLKAKIVKKSLPDNIAKISLTKGKKVRKRGKKKKRVSENNIERSNNVKENEKKHILSEMNQKDTSNKEQTEKGPQNHKAEEKLGVSRKKQDNQKKNGKLSGSGNQKLQRKKERHLEVVTSQQKEKKKPKLGGLIFMCSAQTKPDCFRYNVMGVSMSKKDLVLGIKPGLKLFLYDFELRLMYGIYKASSSGGTKLEPKAFNGTFPVQVRFDVHKDCYPLPESVFRKAIKDNYNEKNKFDTQLTVKQVRKLIGLFKPIELRSIAPVIQPQPMVTMQNREVFERARESAHNLYKVPYSRDSHAYHEVSRYSLLHLENDQHIPYREVLIAETEELQQPTFLTEKDYLTYGLRRERPNLAPLTSHIAPALEPFPKDHMRDDLLRHPPAIYGDIAPPRGEPSRHDPLLVHGREYQTYVVGSRQELQHSNPSVTAAAASTINSYPRYEHYSSHYGTSALDPYPLAARIDVVPSGSYTLGRSREIYPVETDRITRTESYPTETDHLRRRTNYLTRSDLYTRGESNDVGRLYLAHASSALSDYSRTRDYQRAKHELSVASVSARYSFAGPSHQ